MSVRLCLLLLLASHLTQALDPEARELLATQVDCIVQCLQQEQTSFAQAHLDVIRREFPQHVALIQYYQGIIDFRSDQPAAAMRSFEAVLAAGALPELRSDLLLYLGHSYCQVKRWDAARTLLAEVRQSGPEAVVSDLTLGLGQALYRHAQEIGGSQAEACKMEALGLLETFIAGHPDHPQSAWILFVQAEQEYELLEADLRTATLDGGPAAATMDQQVRRLRARYESLRRKYPDSASATKAQFRIAYLDELLQPPQ